MNTVVAEIQGDLKLWGLAQKVLDKIEDLVRNQFDNFEFGYKDISPSGNTDTQECWIQEVKLTVGSIKFNFDLALAKSNTHSYAMHVVHPKGRDTISLFILKKVSTTLPNKNSVLKFLQDGSAYRRRILHELVHYIVAKRFKSKKSYIDYSNKTSFNSKLARRKGGYADYYNEPTELNTHYFEILHDAILEKLSKRKAVFKTFERFLKFADAVHDKAFLSELTEANLKRLKKRLYQLWSTLKGSKNMSALVSSSERYRRRVPLLVTKRLPVMYAKTQSTKPSKVVSRMSNMKALKVILLRSNVPHISVSGRVVTSKVASPTSGFEIFNNVKLKKTTKTNSENFANFCSKFGIIATSRDLADRSIYGEFHFEFKNRNGNIALWTQYHPVYDNGPKVKQGYLGKVALKVEDSSHFKFGAIRTALRNATEGIEPVFTKLTKSEIHTEFIALINETLNERNAQEAYEKFSQHVSPSYTKLEDLKSKLSNPPNKH